MISTLNHVVDVVEQNLTGEVDVAAVAQRLGMTEYHVRRMFSSLAGMPLSEYVRRRRMTIAAAEVLAVTWLGPSGNPLQGPEALEAFADAMVPAFRRLPVLSQSRYRIDRFLAP